MWFILGGGAIFAAWPPLYAVSFSGFYLAMFVVLLALILRPVGFKYRSKLNSPEWRKTWDILLFIGGFVPSLIFGVAMGNVLQGVPFHFDASLRSFYTGSFWGLLNPYALACGLLSVAMLTMQGASFLMTKTDGIVAKRAMKIKQLMAFLVVVLFLGIGWWTFESLQAYYLVKPMLHDAPSNPLYKQVALKAGGWFDNYKTYPILWAVPAIGLLGAFITSVMARSRYVRLNFLTSSLSVAGIVATVGVSMFPFILPSSTHPSHSLLVWDASSSSLTLLIMLMVALVFMPIILAYTAWVYRVLRGKITAEHIQANDDDAY